MISFRLTSIRTGSSSLLTVARVEVTFERDTLADGIATAQALVDAVDSPVHLHTPGEGERLITPKGWAEREMVANWGHVAKGSPSRLSAEHPYAHYWAPPKPAKLAPAPAVETAPEEPPPPPPAAARKAA